MTTMSTVGGALRARRRTRPLHLGKLEIGSDAPVTVQSMTKTDTRDVAATVDQIWALEAAGCEIVRVAVPVKDAAEKLGAIQKQIRIPLVADIHFNYKLALMALEQGVDGLRLNPGNIGGKQFVMEVVSLAKERRIPIRIGVNGGSLEKDLLARDGGPTARGMVDSALRHIRILEDCGYPEMKISLKASDPAMMIEAYRMLADQVDYPFHLGVTEAGTPTIGAIKSAVGIGTLLAEGIGDTIRVSLSADPVEEVRVGLEILKALGLRKQGITFVSCPGCGRMDVDLVALAAGVEKRLAGLKKNVHVAVMGCLPPGEAVLTPAGPRPVETVAEGDEVIAHDGVSRKVLWTTHRAHQGELVEIQPTGFGLIRLTLDHRVWAFPRPVRRKAGRNRWPRIERVLRDGAEPRWVEAGELAPGWVLASPIFQEKEDRATVTADGLRVLPVEEDLLTLSGYYLAEGTLCGKGGKPYQQCFYFHERESDYVGRLRGALARLGFRTSIAARRHTTEVFARSLALGTLLERLFGRGATAKRLPDWMLRLPHDKQALLIRALWEGDGYVGRVRGYGRATYSSSSHALAAQVHQLLLRQGIPAFLHHRDQAARKRNWVVSVTAKPALIRLAQLLGLPGAPEPGARPTGQVFLDERALYVGVRGVRRVPYTGCVYNLEVEGTHSFATPGAALHNCEVNGPGEARGADVGVAGGRGIGLIFRKGEVVRKVPEAQIVEALWEECQIFLAEQEAAEKAATGED